MIPSTTTQCSAWPMMPYLPGVLRHCMMWTPCNGGSRGARKEYAQVPTPTSRAIAGQQLLDLGQRRAAHRLAVHRAGRRLADAVLREDRRLHLVHAGAEADLRVGLDGVALDAEAPLAEFV